MEAILLRNLPEGVGEVHVWKKYSLQENVSYTWNRWSVVETVTYKWNKWNVDKAAVSQGSSTFRVSVPNEGSSSAYMYRGWSIQNGSFVGSNGTTVYFYQNSSGTDITGMHSISGSTLKTITGSPSMYDDYPYYYWVYPCSVYGIGNVKGSTSYGQVTSTNSSAYPSNDISGSYWYESAGSDTTYSKGSISYPDVSSTSDSAYPNPGHQDGYWYENRQEVITYSMGSYIEDVFSTNPKRYPENGIDGSYWYVLQS